MRILFLVSTPNWAVQASDYNGGGWAGALISKVREAGVTVGIAFQSTLPSQEAAEGFYPIPIRQPGFWGKFVRYHGGYRRETYSYLLPAIHQAVADFRPDVIYLFGFENPLAVILGETDVPVLVHIQGLLGPYSRAYLPQGIRLSDFYHPFSAREWIYRNGFVYAYHFIRLHGSQEPSLIAKAHYVTGRTDWDKREVLQYAPEAKYYPVWEMLRPVFYANAGRAVCRRIPDGEPIRLVSTISETAYKGLDVIMKAAAWMQEAGIPFSWHVAGIGKDAFLTQVFERALKLKAERLPLVFCGCLSEEQLVRELTEADVYVHPSYIDNSPNSVCEAQLLGLPVIATRVGGVPSLVEDGVTGLLVPAGDGQALGEAVRNCLDPDLRSRLGKAAGETAACRHDRETILNNLQEVWCEIAAIG